MIKQYPLTVPANGAVRPKITGNYLHLKTTSAPSVVLRVRAYDSESAPVVDLEMSKGDKTHVKNYRRIEIENNTGSAEDIVILAGDGEDFDAGDGTQDVSVTNAVLVTEETAHASATGLTPLTFNGAASQQVAAKSTRKVLDILADAGNAGKIYVASTDATKGIPLAAGQSYSIYVDGAINFFGDTNLDKLHLIEVE